MLIEIAPIKNINVPYGLDCFTVNDATKTNCFALIRSHLVQALYFIVFIMAIDKLKYVNTFAFTPIAYLNLTFLMSESRNKRFISHKFCHFC